MTPPEAAPQTDAERCHACRGTGQVSSSLGGPAHLVECPWCEGTGRFIPGHDAQAARVSS